MTAGTRTRVNVWRMNTLADNSVGGAMVSGTVVYEHVQIMFQQQPSEQLILQQGLENHRIFKGTISPGTLDIRERDELEVVFPFNHPYFGDKFRIINNPYSSHLPYDPRNYILVEMVRSVFAHAQQ